MRDEMLGALDRARAWEASTLAKRPDIARRVISLAKGT
jgi:hypothetical protein